jgi:hypothetical protein
MAPTMNVQLHNTRPKTSMFTVHKTDQKTAKRYFQVIPRKSFSTHFD